jgi:putative endonuclease
MGTRLALHLIIPQVLSIFFRTRERDWSHPERSTDAFYRDEVEGYPKTRERELKTAWVYLLECSDRSYYVGCTTNLAQRLEQHHQGTFSGYTARRRPVVLKWYGETNDINSAIVTERQIKGWSRAKKEALIRGDWETLHELSLSTEAKKRKRKSVLPTDSLRLRAAKDAALRSD